MFELDLQNIELWLSIRVKGPSDRERTSDRERRAVGWVPTPNSHPLADMFEPDVQNIELWLSIQVQGSEGDLLIMNEQLWAGSPQTAIHCLKCFNWLFKILNFG